MVNKIISIAKDAATGDSHTLPIAARLVMPAAVEMEATPP
jgi:hypothetical protein